MITRRPAGAASAVPARKLHVEPGPLVGPRALRPDPPLVQGHELLHDRKAEAGGDLAAGGPGGEALEPAEELRLVVLREPRPLVAHLDDDRPAVASHAQPDRPAFRGVLDRVADQVLEHLPE